MIDGIKNGLSSGIGSIPSLGDLKTVTKPEKTEKSSSFQDTLKQALGEVERLQLDADLKIEGLSTGKPEVTPHDAMIALEKADVAFQLMSAIKTKIIRAYEEVMRTAV